MMEKKLYDKDLGTVLLRAHPRATRYSLRIKHTTLVALMPQKGDPEKLLALISANKQKLVEMLREARAQHPPLNEHTTLQTNTFKLHIFRAERLHTAMKLSNGILHIACPLHTDFTSESTRTLLHTLLQKALRHEARRILPGRLQTLAQQHHFTYTGLRITQARTRWGSCSSKGIISLSLSLMLLPDHLIDYVILHELCHTREMNHSRPFWNLMDQVTDNRARALRNELKHHRPLTE
jgi:predicted metal-dependent hydrolase